jgi:hypothetical protein
MSHSWDKQETDSAILAKNHGFREQICAVIEDLSGSLSAAQLKVLLPNSTMEECKFSSHIASRPFKACIFIVTRWPQQFFPQRDSRGDLLFSQKTLEGGTVAAQAAHNCCPWYSILLLGHKPHFSRYWNFFKLSSSIFTKQLVKNSSKKKKGWNHGRLWQPHGLAG